MSDLDDLLNSLTDGPSQQNNQQDELDDVLNALNDMVEKKDTKKQKTEDDLDDLLDSLDAKPKVEIKQKKADDLDNLLGSLDSKPAVKPTPVTKPVTTPAKPQPPKDDLDDLLDGLDAKPKPTPVTKSVTTPAKPQPPKDDLDDLLDGLDDKPKPTPVTKPVIAPVKPQPPKDDLDDLLDGLEDKPKPTPVAKTATTPSKPQPPKDDLDDLLNGLDDKPKPAVKPVMKSSAKPQPPKDDLDDLLNGLDDKPKTAPKAQNDDLDDLLSGLEDKPKSTMKPKQQPKDDLDDLLDGIDSNAPKKPANAPVPIQAIIDEDPNICAECGQPLGPQRITALGRNYHPDHFVCKNCKTPLGTNPFHNVENCPYCKDCYVAKFAKICARCGKPITNNMVNALGKTYHSTCFVCTRCSKPFPTPSFFQKDNNPYCEECYKEECAVKCATCNKPIIGSSLSALGKKFHPECFVCSVCKAPFPRGQFYNLDGKPVCAEHYNKGTTNNVCGRCSKPIAPGSNFISAMGQKFHPEHFVCSFCVNPLTESSFKENGGKPYCFTCYGKLFG